MIKINQKAENDPMHIEEVDISMVVANDYNPNVMADDKFDMLTEDVEVEDMDQPVVVRYDADQEKYVIVDGEHRWRASQNAGKQTVLVSIKQWDKQEAKLRTVRRNLLRGELDPGRFSQLVRQVESEQDLNVNDVRKRMGFTSEKEFARVYRDEEALTEKAIEKISEDFEDAGKDMSMVSEIVRAIVIKYGDAIKSGTICFVHNKSVVLGVHVSNDQSQQLQLIADLIRDLKLTKGALSEKVDIAMAGLLDMLEAELTD